MTNKVKAKPLSQIRQENKLAKMKKKAKVASKMTQKQQAKEEMLIKSKEAFGKLNETLKKARSVRKDSELSLEEYFPKAINELDQTLTEIVSSIQSMGEMRSHLGWERLKGNFNPDEVAKFETSLSELETTNKTFEDRIVEVVNNSVQNLEELKKQPTREALDAFVLQSSTNAFIVFADWNETVIDKFHATSDLLDSLTTGEEK